jgi:hypothetical protein
MEEKKDYNTQIDELIKQADQQFVQFIKDGKYKDVLLTMSNLNNYSLRNQMLIMLQRQNATCVNGMTTWNYFKRNIMKGEKGIRIIAPTKYEIEKQTEKENGEIDIVKEEKIGYKIAYVFDISQTEGEREIRNFVCNEEMVREYFNELKSILENTIKNYTFIYTDTLKNGCDGLCNYKDKLINIRDGMPMEKTITTLIHEIAHAIAEERTQDTFKGLTTTEVKQIKEIEAESVALVVSNKLGLHTVDFNLAYISGWADGNIEKFRHNLDTIRSISHQLLSAIEPRIQGLEREKEKVRENTQQQNIEVKISENEPIVKTVAKKTKSKKTEVVAC